MRYELTLHYRGDLKSNGNSEHKHDLRKQFHKQLKNYLNQDRHKSLINGVMSHLEIHRDNFNFVPIISNDIYMAAEIDIFLLRPGPKGCIVTNGGDIDNRLKTLFDSLKVPENNALPHNCSPDPEENPFYCLLKDDSLITSLKVSTDELLEKTAGGATVELFIKVIGSETEPFVITTRS